MRLLGIIGYGCVCFTLAVQCVVTSYVWMHSADGGLLPNWAGPFGFVMATGAAVHALILDRRRKLTGVMK